MTEIAKFTPEQALSYENSLKYCRDIKASLDTKYEEGIEKGIKKVARELLNNNVDIETIIKSTGLTKEQIERLRKSED